MAAPSRIAVTTSFRYPGPTGSPVLSMQATRALASEAPEVFVTRYGGWRGWRRRRTWWEGIAVDTIPLLALPAALVRARRRPPDVVHAHGTLGAKLGAVLSAATGAPLVVEFHEVEPLVPRHLTGLRRLGHGMSRHLVRRQMAAAIVLSERQRARLDGLHVRPPLGATVIYPPVDDEFFGDEPLAPAAAAPRIGYAGNFMPWQGVDLLVEAMDEVWAQHPDAVLCLWGADDAALAQWRSRLADAAGPWELHGRLDLHEMPAVLRGVDVLVIPRPDVEQNSTTGRKLGEYLASGRALVVTDVADHRLLLATDQAALVVAPDAKAIAGGILATLDDPTAARERAGRGLQIARDRFRLGPATTRRLALFEAAAERAADRKRVHRP